MVLLPDPDKYKPPAPITDFEKRKVFFEHPELDEMAKYFIGNNYRFVKNNMKIFFF